MDKRQFNIVESEDGDEEQNLGVAANELSSKRIRDYDCRKMSNPMSDESQEYTV